MNRKEIADVLGVTPRQIDNYVVDGIPWKKIGRCWDYGVAAVAWHYQRKLDAIEQKRPPSLDEARARKEIAQAELAEYQLAEIRGQMVSEKVRARERNVLLDLLRARILNIPGKWATVFVGLRSFGAARTVLERLVDELLAALSHGVADDLDDLDVPEMKPDAGNAPKRRKKVAKRNRRRRKKAA